MRECVRGRGGEGAAGPQLRREGVGVGVGVGVVGGSKCRGMYVRWVLQWRWVE